MNQKIKRAELLPCPFCGSTNIEIQISTPDREGVPTNLICSDCGASGPWEYEQANSHAKADSAWNRRAVLPTQPKSEFEDPRVQKVYEIICGDNHPPEGEHWDGYVSRLIVDALQSQEYTAAMSTTILTDEQIDATLESLDCLFWDVSEGATHDFARAIEQAVLQSERVQALREALRAAAEYIGDRSAGSSRFWELYDAAMEKQT